MRRLLFVSGTIFLLAGGAASADPYRWCAEYGGGFSGGGTNCYFITLQQCQAAVSGTGGFCRRNQFDTGSRGRRRPATFGAAPGGY